MKTALELVVDTKKQQKKGSDTALFRAMYKVIKDSPNKYEHVNSATFTLVLDAFANNEKIFKIKKQVKLPEVNLEFELA